MQSSTEEGAITEDPGRKILTELSPGSLPNAIYLSQRGDSRPENISTPSSRPTSDPRKAGGQAVTGQATLTY